MQDLNQAKAYIDALGGGVFDFRCIHDQDKSVQGVNLRGLIDDVWSTLVDYNNCGYGCFAVVNETDGQGALSQNFINVRSHFVDLDNLSAMENLQRANDWVMKPSFMVQTSANKAHVYWPVSRYLDGQKYNLVQKKLIQYFDGDPRIWDITRVMRLPGTYHLKGEPQLVTCSALSGFGMWSNVDQLEHCLQYVNVIESVGERFELGDPSKAAPDLNWLQLALDSTDPNSLDRGDWIGFSAAVKQSGWSLTDEQTLFNMWSNWCAKYEFNDLGENLKQWNSIKDTQLGWQSIVARTPNVKGHLIAAGVKPIKPIGHDTGQHVAPPMPAPPVPTLDGSGELLTDGEQRIYFDGCVFIENMGKILVPSGRLLTTTKFNGAYGGKKFIIDEQARVVNEPWQAATRSTLWTIPKADHIRFLPHKDHLEIHVDELGRRGVNSYKPAIIERAEGDPTPFLSHLAAILPIEADRFMFLDYIAHNVKYPGYKIPWAPLIQSAEGVGKNVFKFVIRHAIGRPYCHYPNAKEMADSGSKFNAWMRNKLFIICDEIRVSERRDMIEVLKPMISEKEIEVQGKGDDQENEDNYSNWLFFSNWKDAIPVDPENSRRFCINYSVLQTHDDIIAAGLDDDYFNRLFTWLEDQNGLQIVTNFLLNYPIERGAIPKRAPMTSSFGEAKKQSLGPIDKLILDAVADEIPGFKAGYVSVIAVKKRMSDAGVRKVSDKFISSILENNGYKHIGRATRCYFSEDALNKTELYHIDPNARVDWFGQFQGYE